MRGLYRNISTQQGAKTMQDNTYNGWTNYATWRVNLEIFDGMSADDMGWRGMDR